ncbi:MAG: dockerin-like protein [Alteromonadaceae bacterium]|nr:dockerin-like protein [Alteromonadaceae bacterium]
MAASAEAAQTTQSDPAQPCPSYSPTSFEALSEVTHLPDPFLYATGQRATSLTQWQCVRALTKAQFEHWELGPIPSAPAVVVGSVADKQISVQTGTTDKQIQFTAKVDMPTSGEAPYPAIIRLSKYGLDTRLLNDAGVAVITFDNSELAEQKNGQSRGRGKFYDLFGADHPAGAMTAWSWGLSRIIDVIDKTDQHLIDRSRIGVTGCSRYGKGAIVAGAFDERLVLTIAQESGSGGAASWRISDHQQAQGQNVQTQRQIVTENVWFRDNFKQFSGHTNKLPVDHHQLMGLIAPRGLLVLENTSMEWLGNASTFLTSVVAKTIWLALGVPANIGITQTGGHSHCHLPDSQLPDVKHFIDRFLLEKAVNPSEILKTDGNYPTSPEDWQKWTVPTLKRID